MLSALELTRAYAQALLVDREGLDAYQQGNDALQATQALKRAFTTDLGPILRRARQRKGAAIDPIAVYRSCGYREGVAKQRPAVARSGKGLFDCVAV
jgi:L-rhamnose isomerase/sugar isomerase